MQADRVLLYTSPVNVITGADTAHIRTYSIVSPVLHIRTYKHALVLIARLERERFFDAEILLDCFDDVSKKRSRVFKRLI